MDTSDFFASLFTDTQLNGLAVSGIALYFFAHYALSRHWCEEHDWWNRALRSIGLICIFIPLFGKWYLSSSILAATGIMITMASVVGLCLRRLK